ncbi:MAG: hypothetical protein RDU20_07285 [Desulfomonilaceae bacterium]|nr:hypothetical protein [Desulfomonilaceae bacterium]
MNRVRSVAVAVMVGLLLCVSGSQARAWEFAMDGAFTFELEEMGQTGRNGFFGPYDVDAGSGVQLPGFYAPYNFWIGSPDVGTPGVVSGSDAGWNTQYMGVNMELRMNKALRIRGLYYIGAWNPDGTGLLVASEYLNQSFPGIQQSFSPGYWNTLWLTAQLPWGQVAFGKRPSAWGTGLSWNGDESRSSESLALRTFYGPLSFQISFYPSRRGNVGSVQYYNRDVDKSNSRLWDITIPNLVYRCGPIDLGVQYVLINRHSGGEAFVPDPGGNPAARLTQNYRDRDDLYSGVYFKYYNGRFFFNSEVTWYEQTTRNRRKIAGGGPAPGTRDDYIEHWRYVVEASVLAGPARVALLHAWLQGDDRRGGQFLNGVQAPGNVTYIDRRGSLRSNSFANSGLFRPYSLILAYQYGTGMFINGDTGNGYMEDAVVFAARADYALAANLNVYGTFFWAERQSKSGFGWGAIAPDTGASDGSIVMRGTANADRVGAPNIPDTALGWEIDLGFDWKLLEGLVVSSTLGYWQPGAWYKFACIDKSVVNWGVAGAPGSTNPADWGINPNRSIDPVWQWQILVNGEF